VSESFFSSTIKNSFEHKTLCECSHRRLDHRLLNSYAREEEEATSSLEYPEILCRCGCVTFKLITNLRYLEILEKEKADGLLDNRA